MTTLESPPEVRGVVRLTEAQLRVQRRVTLAVTLIPLIGVVFAMWQLWGTRSAGSTSRSSCRSISRPVSASRSATTGCSRTAASRPSGPCGSCSRSSARWPSKARVDRLVRDAPPSPRVRRSVRRPALSAPGAGGRLKGVLLGLWHAHIGMAVRQRSDRPERVGAGPRRRPGHRARSASCSRGSRSATFVLPPLIGFAITESFSAAC